jgi:hypothetical protein
MTGATPLIESTKPIMYILPVEHLVLAHVPEAELLDWKEALALATARNAEAACWLETDCLAESACSLICCSYKDVLKGVLEIIDDAGEAPEDPNNTLTEIYQFIEYVLDGQVHEEVSHD